MAERQSSSLTLEQFIAIAGLVIAAVALGFALGYAF